MSDEPEAIAEPDMPREIVREIHDHETLLAWSGDDDAILFAEWWNEKGFAAFSKWATKEKARRS